METLKLAKLLGRGDYSLHKILSEFFFFLSLFHNDRKFMLNSSYMLHGNCTRQCIRNKTFLFVKIES